MFYLQQDECGSGLPRFSDKAQIMKWETFIRCLAVEGASASSVHCFLARLPQPTLPGENHLKTVTTPREWTRKKHFTARSIIEWLAVKKA
jgi:hypothetical protein